MQLVVECMWQTLPSKPNLVTLSLDCLLRRDYQQTLFRSKQSIPLYRMSLYPRTKRKEDIPVESPDSTSKK